MNYRIAFVLVAALTASTAASTAALAEAQNPGPNGYPTWSSWYDNFPAQPPAYSVPVEQQSRSPEPSGRIAERGSGSSTAAQAPAPQRQVERTDCIVCTPEPDGSGPAAQPERTDCIDCRPGRTSGRTDRIVTRPEDR
jgi:hypothetical protein